MWTAHLTSASETRFLRPCDITPPPHGQATSRPSWRLVFSAASNQIDRIVIPGLISLPIGVVL